MIVYAFPGQGSQSPQMGLDLAAHFPVFARLAAQASDTLGFDLLEIVRQGDALDQTSYTQPALLWAGYSSFIAWQDHGGPAPTHLCGHSLGEYTALTAAQVLSFTDAIGLVHHRGQLMQQQIAPADALMAAVIGLEDAQVQSLCDRICTSLEDPTAIQPANYNSAGQVVVAGKSIALQPLVQFGKAQGARRVIPLQMSVPSHCSLMDGARRQLAEYAESIPFHHARYPVIQNVDARARTDANDIRQALLQQLTSPVRWRQTMEACNGATMCIESGPGAVLQGLARRTLPEVPRLGIGDLTSFNQAAADYGLALAGSP